MSQAFSIDSSSGVRIRDLTIQNAQQMHFTISRSDTIRVSGVRIRSPRDSPNTDGIHISDSTNIAIQNCRIGTGMHNCLKSLVYTDDKKFGTQVIN